MLEDKNEPIRIVVDWDNSDAETSAKVQQLKTTRRLNEIARQMSIDGAEVPESLMKPDMIALSNASIQRAKDYFLATSLTIEAINGKGIVDETPAYQPSFFLDLLLPTDIADDMQANLQDYFPIWVSRHGLRKALWICRGQVFRMIIGTHWGKVLSLLKVLRLSGG